MNGLLPQETRLVGKFRLIDDRVVADQVSARIDQLIETYLQQERAHESGREVLFRDPNDDRCWERTYPQGELQGGGPPSLTCLSFEIANAKYELSD